MKQDIQSQFERAEQLLGQLRQSCYSDFHSKQVSRLTKNLCQEVLTKVRCVLDQSFFMFYKKHYFHVGLANRHQVYFPIQDNKDSFLKKLRDMKMDNLEQSQPDFYHFLDSIQPYHSSYSWLKLMKIYSNEKHVQLTPQKLKFENETIISSIHVGKGSKVIMRNCLINGIPIDSEDINEAPLESFDPRLPVLRKTWGSFLFEGTDIDVLWLCAQSVGEGEKIVERIIRAAS